MTYKLRWNSQLFTVNPLAGNFKPWVSYYYYFVRSCQSFLPEASFGLRVLSLPASVCLCVCPSVCVCGKYLLVRAITHHPFKLGSLNLDHRCKRPWLRSLLFWGWLTLTFKVKFNFKVKIYPILSLSMPWLTTNWSCNFSNLEQKCILALFRSLPILGLIEIDLQFNF